MGDLTSTNCGCRQDPCQSNNGCGSIIWILLILCMCGNNGSTFGGCGSSCGDDCGSGNFCWIIILLLFCGGGGNNLCC